MVGGRGRWVNERDAVNIFTNCALQCSGRNILCKNAKTNKYGKMYQLIKIKIDL